MSMPPARWSKRTLAAQAMGTTDPITRAVVPPIHVSTTYLRDEDNAYSSGFVYGRPDNATVREAEAVVAMLEEAPAALLFSSGMAAATAVFMALDPGDHVVAPRVMYWALRNWLMTEATRWGLQVDFCETDDLDRLRAAMRPGRTKLVWLETPSNPLWTITDIAAAAEIAHAAGARLAVDSTCASPIHTRPLSLGADVVMHAATKILNGHTDVVSGALAGLGPDDPFWARIVGIRKTGGAILGPFEAFLLLRGLRTLPLRAAAQARAAMDLAQRLSEHRHVARVLYPGLPQHPGHDVAARQMEGGFGYMLSIQVSGGERAAISTAARVGLWKRATSLGGVESLIEHRASIEGPGTPCPPDLLRLSAGIEDPDDLFTDLDEALRAAHG
jgi:cystathionine gamma-synthase